MAAPQVAGLAAYLWSLNPSLSVAALRDMIIRSDLNNQVNAYAAVQELDPSLANPKVRMGLLDVANASDSEVPDGKFTEHDIAKFLEKFHLFEQQRGGPGGAPDYSRYDLNGDGFTGDSSATDGLFDLDVNSPQSFGTATATSCGSDESFDETHLSDYDILRYYAYSSLYSGDPVQRDALLKTTCARYTILADSSHYSVSGGSFQAPFVGFFQSGIQPVADSLDTLISQSPSEPCQGGLHFIMASSTTGSLSASVSDSSLDITGTVTSHAGTSANTQDTSLSNCDHSVSAVGEADRKVLFRISGGGLVNVTFDVTGTTSLTGLRRAISYNSAGIIGFIDYAGTSNSGIVEFDTRGGIDHLPFHYSAQFPADTTYLFGLGTVCQLETSAISDPGPGNATATANVRLHISFGAAAPQKTRASSVAVRTH